MIDGFGRKIDYMRISITDRCNLRCRYCMPEGIRLVPMQEILTFEEIELVCKAAVELGIRKFKITGGEPLVRLGCPQLVGKIKRIAGVEQVTLTTNGIFLGRDLDELLENGLDAVNVSLDTLDDDTYRQITQIGELQDVRESIGKALEKGLHVKINSVLQKGVNDHEWVELIELAREQPLDVRFIEMMPIGYGEKENGIKGNDIVSMMRKKYLGIQEDSRVHGNGPAVYYQIPGFRGSIGFISAVHGQFCGRCNRIRLTAKGELKPCLCYEESIDVKHTIREKAAKGQTEMEILSDIRNLIRETVSRKPQMHCFDREDGITEGRQMVQIGG